MGFLCAANSPAVEVGSDHDANESALSVPVNASREKPDFVGAAHEFLILTKDQKEKMRAFEVWCFFPCLDRTRSLVPKRGGVKRLNFDTLEKRWKTRWFIVHSGLTAKRCGSFFLIYFS